MADGSYVALWEVDDPYATLPALMALAEPELERMADEARVKLIGEPRWLLAVGRLVALVPAIELPGRYDRERTRPWEDRDVWLDDLLVVE